MYSLCHSERPFVILSASEESVSSPPIFSSSPSPDMCAGIHRYTLCMASRLRTSPHFPRHLRRQSPSHAVFPTFPAHISTPKPTSAQPNPDSRPESYPLCALLGISSDICAADPLPTPYIQLSLHTSQLLNRHVRWQTLTHALSGILHAHFPAFPMTSAQTIPLPRRIFNFSCALLGIHRFPRSFTPFQDNGTRFEVTDPSLRLVSVQDDRNAAAFRMAGDAI